MKSLKFRTQGPEHCEHCYAASAMPSRTAAAKLLSLKQPDRYAAAGYNS